MSCFITYVSVSCQGILDIVVLSKGYKTNDFAIHTLKNNFEADAYFVKVIGEYLSYMFYLFKY